MTVTGTIQRIEALKEVGQNNFKVRDVIIKTEEQYPQTLAIKFTQNLAENFTFKVGENVKIDINLKGREFTNAEGEVRVFNSIDGWKIQKV